MVHYKIIIHFCCCAAIFPITISASAQINIIGTVVTESGNTPVAKASVYLNNTTIGTFTDNLGNFSFDSVKLLNTEMVISCKGYEVLVFKPTTEQIKNKRVIIKLQPKLVTLKSNLSFENNLQKQQALAILYENLLGITEEAEKCIIENENSIKFIQGDTYTGFLAYSDTPIIVINNVLGYKMKIDLIGFSYDEATAQNEMLAYILYEKLGDNNKWVNNRHNVYYGSSMHFFRSLIANKLFEQSFNLFLIPALKPILKANMPTELLGTGAEEERSRAVPVAAQDVLYIDSTNNFSLKVDGSLIVEYLKNPYAKKYLLKHSFYEGALQRGVESYLELRVPLVGLNSAGVLSNPLNVKITGYWMYEKAANTLPFDYNPN